AEAIYSPEGKKQVKELIEYYMTNASHIKTEMQKIGYSCTGGENSPYIWVQAKMKSWDFFDMLLEKANVVCTPGSGFGKCGEGYIRISAFNNYEKVKEAMERIAGVLG
ncbi:MAG: aminotransferase class I/II-fold pyridoxal phosphate-dependent enzyme, partial [Candidatus Pacearchaeota archaeon]|nr:aminotransferase class I/II-fold pyridoxal phosphate-dependent enzyme [Candidatus Pacearchaeota archaeon]